MSVIPSISWSFWKAIHWSQLFCHWTLYSWAGSSRNVSLFLSHMLKQLHFCPKINLDDLLILFINLGILLKRNSKLPSKINPHYKYSKQLHKSKAMIICFVGPNSSPSLYLYCLPRDHISSYLRCGVSHGPGCVTGSPHRFFVWASRNLPYLYLLMCFRCQRKTCPH